MKAEIPNYNFDYPKKNEPTNSADYIQTVLNQPTVDITSLLELLREHSAKFTLAVHTDEGLTGHAIPQWGGGGAVTGVGSYRTKDFYTYTVSGPGFKLTVDYTRSSITTQQMRTIQFVSNSNTVTITAGEVAHKQQNELFRIILDYQKARVQKEISDKQSRLDKLVAGVPNVQTPR